MSFKWIEPGKPFETELGDKIVKLKSHKRDERKEMFESSRELTDDEFFDFILGEIVSIEDVNDVKEFLSWQSTKTTSRIYNCIIAGDSLTEEDVKNFVSLSAMSRLEKTARDIPNAKTAKKEPVSS